MITASCTQVQVLPRAGDHGDAISHQQEPRAYPAVLHLVRSVRSCSLLFAWSMQRSPDLR